MASRRSRRRGELGDGEAQVSWGLGLRLGLRARRDAAGQRRTRDGRERRAGDGQETDKRRTSDGQETDRRRARDGQETDTLSLIR